MGKINLFGCDKERLAQILAGNPEIFNDAMRFFVTLRGGVFSEQFDLERCLDFLNRANEIARESDVFVFDIYDSWAERDHGDGCGYAVYHYVGSKMIQDLGFRSGKPPSMEEAMGFLRLQAINRVYTFPPPGLGIELSKKVGDGHVYEHRAIHPDSFKDEGIEVIVLEN